ncbi:MAG: 50S ribosomal protein L23 [Metamycoplasmataceae bacterium]
MNINHIIKYPLLTEKTYQQMGKNIYTFVVDKKATKIEIKKAVQFIFDVKVDRVNIMNVDKKYKKLGKYEGFKPGYKKAIVTLSEGSIKILPDDNFAQPEEKATEKIAEVKEVSKAEKKAAEKLSKVSEKLIVEKPASSKTKKESK